MGNRKNLPRKVEAEVLTRSRRRCCICFGLSRDKTVKEGQIAHLDHDPSNGASDNLAFLCLTHHDRYDSRTSQSKGFTHEEVTIFRYELFEFLEGTHNALPRIADIHFLDIAARYSEMIKKNGHSVEGLAKKYKKSPTIIRELLHVNDKLPVVARRASRNGAITKSICVLICTIPNENRRTKFAKEVLVGGKHGEPMSHRVAKQWKEARYMQELKGAPFPLDDPTLDPGWGSTCLKCRYYNGNQPERQQGKRSDMCLNPDHYTKLVRLNAERLTANTKNPPR